MGIFRDGKTSEVRAGVGTIFNIGEQSEQYLIIAANADDYYLGVIDLINYKTGPVWLRVEDPNWLTVDEFTKLANFTNAATSDFSFNEMPRLKLPY